MMEKLSEQVETKIHTLAHVERTWSRAISRIPLSTPHPLPSPPLPPFHSTTTTTAKQPTPLNFIACGDKKMPIQMDEQEGKQKEQVGQGEKEKREVEEYFRKLVENIDSVEAHVVELQVLLLDYKHHLQTIHQKTTK